MAVFAVNYYFLIVRHTFQNYFIIMTWCFIGGRIKVNGASFAYWLILMNGRVFLFLFFPFFLFRPTFRAVYCNNNKGKEKND